jgi:hypothetical protein
MKKVNIQDRDKVLELIKRITVEVENAKPSKERMIEDVKMMNFKIRPLVGDVFQFIKKEVGFLESLWKIGKIEEIVTGGLPELNNEEKMVFLRYLDGLQRQMEKTPTSIIKQFNPEESKNINILELEIFRENRRKRNPN